MMNKFKIELGDWSDDGHGKTEVYMLESDLTVAETREAYIRSINFTGIEFQKEIANAYDDNTLSEIVYLNFKEHGFDFTKHEDEEEYEEIYICPDFYVEMLIWFIKLSAPESTIKVIDDEIPCFNGFWNKDPRINSHFGYGLFS